MGCYDYHKEEKADTEALYEKRPEVTPENPYKVYVSVTAVFSTEGVMKPVRMVWEDGRTYEIDAVCKISRMASRKTGGSGIRYLCRILGKPVELYYEENGMWFVRRRSVC